jgi:hypothetical protein
MLGLLVGAVGVISIIPALTELMIGVFGLSQIIWLLGSSQAGWHRNPWLMGILMKACC